MPQVVDLIGGPDRDRTDDLFHAMEARSQLRHRPTRWEMQLSYCPCSSAIRQTSERRRTVLSMPGAMARRGSVGGAKARRSAAGDEEQA